MTKKKIIALLLCVLTVFSSAFTVAFAADSEETSVPFIIEAFEESVGKLVNCFAKAWNKLVKTDETNIPEPAVSAPSWKEYNGDNYYFVEHICGPFYYYEASF